MSCVAYEWLSKWCVQNNKQNVRRCRWHSAKLIDLTWRNVRRRRVSPLTFPTWSVVHRRNERLRWLPASSRNRTYFVVVVATHQPNDKNLWVWWYWVITNGDWCMPCTIFGRNQITFGWHLASKFVDSSVGHSAKRTRIHTKGIEIISQLNWMDSLYPNGIAVENVASRTGTSDCAILWGKSTRGRTRWICIYCFCLCLRWR